VDEEVDGYSEQDSRGNIVEERERDELTVEGENNVEGGENTIWDKPEGTGAVAGTMLGTGEVLVLMAQLNPIQ
jgi:hypothetical protein